MNAPDLAPLPQRVPSEPEGLPVEAAATPTEAVAPKFTDMEGWFREVTITGPDRTPLQTEAEVTKEHGLPYGKAVGKIILPGREKPVSFPDAIEKDLQATLPSSPVVSREVVEDQSLRTLHIFDARTGEHAPAHFIVASESALRRIAALPPRLRGIAARLSRDVRHIYEGENLKVGAGEGRWMPSLLRRRERQVQDRGHHGRTVISREQTFFYVGQDRELHVRSEGYNPDTLVARPNQVEARHMQAKKDYERGMRERIARARRVREEELGQAATAHLYTHRRTEHVSRHARDDTKVLV